ncbi:MAG: hypothetical protein ACOYVK_02600 [Bacillota bacterium]
MNRRRLKFGAAHAQNMIDATYNGMDYPIINKSQNSYLMPENMKRDVDYIDSFRFYENTAEFNQILEAYNNPTSK